MYLRRNIPVGPVDIALATLNTPFLEAYRFDRGFQLKFGAPDPALTYGLTGAFGVQISPTNFHVLVTGNASDSVRTYDMGADTLTNGVDFQTADPTNLPLQICITEDGSGLVIGGSKELGEYDYSAAPTIGALLNSYVHPTPDLSPRGGYEKLYTVGNFTIAYTGPSTTANQRGTIAVYDRSNYNEVSQVTSGVTVGVLGEGDGRCMSLAPTPIDSGERVMAYVTEDVGDSIKSLKLISMSPIGTLNFYDQDDTIGAVYAGFATGNRLIIATDTELQLHQLLGDGGLMLKDSVPFAAGAVKSMQFDVVSDILYVGSDTSPYLTAVPVSATGIDSKFGDPVPVPVGETIQRMSIRYDNYINFQM